MSNRVWIALALGGWLGLAWSAMQPEAHAQTRDCCPSLEICSAGLSTCSTQLGTCQMQLAVCGNGVGGGTFWGVPRSQSGGGFTWMEGLDDQLETLARERAKYPEVKLSPKSEEILRNVAGNAADPAALDKLKAAVEIIEALNAKDRQSTPAKPAPPVAPPPHR